MPGVQKPHWLAPQSHERVGPAVTALGVEPVEV